MKHINLKKIPRKYHGKWVIWESSNLERVLVAGNSIAQLLQKAEKIGLKGLIISHIPVSV